MMNIVTNDLKTKDDNTLKHAQEAVMTVRGGKKHRNQ